MILKRSSDMGVRLAFISKKLDMEYKIDMQEKYWKYMVQIKAWIFYLDLYAEASYKWDKWINILGAIASSTSIAAWAIWQQLSFVWSIIIAVSQILTAIKGYLPYNKRLKSLVPLIEDLKFLYNKIEYSWLKVASGELTEEEINDILYKFKNEFTNIENKNLKEETLLENKKFMKIADEKTDLYFENNF